MKINYSKNYDLLNLISNLKTKKKILKTKAMIGLEEFRENTKTGKDANGKRFHKYSKMTKAFKKKWGKSQTLVNLTCGIENGKAVSGGMMTSISIKSDNDSAETYFIDAKKGDLAYDHQTGAGRLPIREFVGWTKKALSRVDKHIDKQIDKWINNI